MKKYISFFRLRFSMGLQYRAAAWAGVVTQFAWGFLELMAFRAFYESDSSAFPMEFSAMVSYIWIQQAFLALYMAWMVENEILEAIVNGNIAYELCRPINIYNMWFSRSVANRLSKAVLRCFPVLLVAFLLPEPYGITLPDSVGKIVLFLITLTLAFLVTVAFCVLVYTLTFYTISPMGLRILFVSIVEFFAGAVIPLPFFPDQLRNVMELLPFAAMQNVPLRIYSGDLSGIPMVKAIVLQVFWLAVLIIIGKLLCRRALRRVALQGG